MEIIILAPKFERLWKDSMIEQQQQACVYIKECSLNCLRLWVTNHPSIELGEMNIRQLRERGRKADVRNYSRKDKSELIIEIQFKESRRDKVRNDLSNQDNGGKYGANDSKNRTQEEPVTNSQGR